MASPLRKSLKLFFGMVRKSKLEREYQIRVAKYDREFLAKVTDPKFEDGHIYRMYQEGLRKIRNWFDVSQPK